MGSIIIKYKFHSNINNFQTDDSGLVRPKNFKKFEEELITLLRDEYGTLTNDYPPVQNSKKANKNTLHVRYIFGEKSAIESTIDNSAQKQTSAAQNTKKVTLDVLLNHKAVKSDIITRLVDYGLCEPDADEKTSKYTGQLTINGIRFMRDEARLIRLLEAIKKITHNNEYNNAIINIYFKSTLNLHSLFSEQKIYHKPASVQTPVLQDQL